MALLLKEPCAFAIEGSTPDRTEIPACGKPNIYKDAARNRPLLLFLKNPCFWNSYIAGSATVLQREGRAGTK